MRVKAKKDLFNGGQCFTAGEVYEIKTHLQNYTPATNAGLMDFHAINDQGEKHLIGSWWRNFKIVK